MPATMTPPAASTGFAPAESTRQSASSRCSGRSRTSESWPGLSTRAIASRSRRSSHQNRSAPSGSVTPGNRRAPLETTLSAPSIDALADHAHAVDHAVIPDPHARRHDAAAQRAVCPDHGALHHDRALDRRALTHDHPVLEHRATTDPGTVADHAVALDQRGGHDPAPDSTPSSTHTKVAPIRAATSVCTVPSRMSNVASR